MFSERFSIFLIKLHFKKCILKKYFNKFHFQNVFSENIFRFPKFHFQKFILRFFHFYRFDLNLFFCWYQRGGMGRITFCISTLICMDSWGCRVERSGGYDIKAEWVWATMEISEVILGSSYGLFSSPFLLFSGIDKGKMRGINARVHKVDFPFSLSIFPLSCTRKIQRINPCIPSLFLLFSIPCIFLSLL